MKKIIYIIAASAMITACSGFLDKGPITKPSTFSYFKTRPQIETYVNNLYLKLPTYGKFSMGMLAVDKNSDNIISENYDLRLNGEFKANNSQSEWQNISANLRNCNYVLKYNQVHIPGDKSKWSGDIPETASLIGEVYFLRAYWNFEALRMFGNFPKVDRLYDDNASLKALQLPQISRDQLADFILSDLDKAIDMLLPRSHYNGLRINKEAAIALASNVSLYEGTWEYYHKNDAFAAPTDRSAEFLQKTITYSKALIDGGTVKLHTLPNDKSGKAFSELFKSYDLSNDSEVLLWRKYDPTAGVYNIVAPYLASGMTDFNGKAAAGITQDMVDNYLMKDGSFVNTSDPNYREFNNTFKDRDPRLLVTVMNEGSLFKDTTGNISKPLHLDIYRPLPWDKYTDEERKSEEFKEIMKQIRDKSNPDHDKFVQDSIFDSKINPPRINGDAQYRSATGYLIGLATDPKYSQGGVGQTACPIIRYAEVLLNYAEAAAILNQADDAVLDQTIKPLQERAGVTYIKPTQLDPNYPNCGYEISPLIQAIRRERRSELALQGKRQDDIFRWAAADLIKGRRFKGAWFGKESLLYKSFSPSNQKDLNARVLLDENGYLDPVQKLLKNGYNFNENRDYLLPIPPIEMQIEKPLKQNPGW